MPGPSPWLWVLLALVAFVVVVAAGWRRWYGLLALLVVVAVVADLVHTAGAFAASTAPVVAKAYGSLISAAGWVAAILAVWQLRRDRRQAGQLLLLLAGMFLAFAGALPDVGALARSRLASTLDPTLTRAAIALTLGVGLGLLAASLLIPDTTRPPHNHAPGPGRPRSATEIPALAGPAPGHRLGRVHRPGFAMV